VSLLDNAVWHALRTRHARFADVAGRARRYAYEVSFASAVDQFDDESWRDVAALVGPGGTAVFFRDRVPPPPPGWTQVMEGVGHQMVLDQLVPADVPPARLLSVADVPQMLELVALTRPGPFLPRTIELGDYYGVFADDRLVAMAGERLQLPGFTEISAVCTHPDARGRGYASGLTTRVATGILDRGEQPFLHHAAENDDARRVYERLGFSLRRPVTMAVLQPPDAAR